MYYAPPLGTISVRELVDSLLKAIITKNLLQIDPLLSKKEASFMANIALSDYINYVKYKQRLLGKEDSTRTAYLIILEKLSSEKAHLEEDVEQWLKVWLNKWKERVKLTFTEKEFEKIKKNASDDLPLFYSKVKHLHEMKEIAIEALISLGEYCMTELVAIEIVKTILSKIRKEYASDEEALRFVNKYPLFVLERIFKAAKKVSQSKSAFAVVKVDKDVLKSVR